MKKLLAFALGAYLALSVAASAAVCLAPDRIGYEIITHRCGLLIVCNAANDPADWMVYNPLTLYADDII